MPKGGGANRNTIYGMYFHRIGSRYNSNIGYEALGPQNSSGNLIRNNHFLNVENDDPDGSLVHGLYVARHSKRNMIVSNKFLSITGDPMRTRNDSKDSLIEETSSTTPGATPFTPSGSATLTAWRTTPVTLPRLRLARQLVPLQRDRHRYDGDISLWRLFPTRNRHHRRVPAEPTRARAGCAPRATPDRKAQKRIRPR